MPGALLRAVLLVSVHFVVGIVLGAGGAAAAGPDLCPPGRKVIVLAGVRTTGIEERFDYIKRLLNGCDVLEYSYDATYRGDADHAPGTPGRGSDYTIGSAGQNPDESTFMLQKLIDAYPDSEFDLVGHSLGGFIAAYWAATEASPADLRRVHSIVTLDSPLRGRPLLNKYEQPIFNALPVPVLGDLGQAFTFLEPGSTTVERLRTGRLVEKVNVVTVRSTSDGVVPADHATILGVWRDEPFDGGFGDCGWQPYMGALYWGWPGWLFGPKNQVHCWLESHSVVWDAPASALAIRRAITEDSHFPGYRDHGGKTTAANVAASLVEESTAVVRAQPELTVQGEGSLLGLSASGGLSLSGPDTMTGQGTVAGLAWSVADAGGQTMLRIRDWTIDSIPSRGAATVIRDAILGLPSAASSWSLQSVGNQAQLSGRYTPEGLESVYRSLGISAPGNPLTQVVLTVDAGTHLWQTLEFRLSWAVIDTTILGYHLSVGPAATISLSFAAHTAP